MTERVFELQIFRSRWEGYEEPEIPEWDAKLDEFPAWEYVQIAFWQPQPITGLPKRIAFDATYETLDQMDLLYNNAQWPIMSQQMLNTLLSVGEFPHQAIPLVMVDDEMKYSKELNDDVLTGRESDDFIALQLLEHRDLFDWEQSVYQRNSLNPNLLNSLDKLILQSPETGYPPIFRVTSLPRRLFVSAQARTLLEAAGLQGMKFVPLEEFQWANGDVIQLGCTLDFRPTMPRATFENINNPPYDEKYLSYNYQQVLFDPIFSYLFRHGAREPVEIDVFRVLTPGQKALYAVIAFLGQAGEGGFPQVFYNLSPFLHRRISDGLDRIGYPELKMLYDQELQLYQKGLGQGNSSTNPFLSFFLAHRRDLEQKLVDYITTHPDEFVIFSDP
jgi:hypothetical protein